MWIFTCYGFMSVVANKNDPDELLVRARVPGHLEALFPEAEVIEYNDTDYRYRAFLPRTLVAERLADLVEDIDYTNFKNSVPNGLYLTTLHRIWELMFELQVLMKKLLQRDSKKIRKKKSESEESSVEGEKGRWG